MRFQDIPSEGNSSGLPFVKIKDGETIYGVFKGDPVAFGLIWDQKKMVPIGTPKSTFRFRVNFITKEGASYVAKVFEQGKTVYQMLKELNESYPLESTAVSIKRTGSTKDDTYYTILPLPPKQQPADQSWAVIHNVKLLDLQPKAKAAQEPAFDANEPWPDEAPPIDGEELPF